MMIGELISYNSKASAIICDTLIVDTKVLANGP